MKLNQDAPPAKGDETYPKDWPREYVSDSCSRFGARFRIAKAFQTASFASGIAAPTAATYSAFVRFGLVYSAFEVFSKTFRASRGGDLRALEARFPASDVLRIVDDDRNPHKKLLTKISEFLEPKLGARVEAIVAGSERSPFVLAEAVRHAYFHGHLTASTAGSPPDSVKSLVHALSDYLLMIMDETAGAFAAGKLARQRKRGRPAATANSADIILTTSREKC